MASLSDHSLYNIRHRKNRIFIHAQIYDINYQNSPRATRSPRIKVLFVVKHQIVPDDLPRITYLDGASVCVKSKSFRQPPRVFASANAAGPAFDAMLARLELPFELRNQYGRVVWGVGEFNSGGRVRDVAGVLSHAGERVFAEALSPDGGGGRGRGRAVKRVVILVAIKKRTVLEAGVYRSLAGRRIKEKESEDRFLAAVDMMERERYEGGDGDGGGGCAICVQDVLIGSHVFRLPCSHRFHGDCIVEWLLRSQTCPCCRFQLLKSY